MNLYPSAKRILVVEDEVVCAADLRHRLEGLGHEVVGVAGRGDEALDQALRLEPDLLLVDVVLPGDFDGIEAVRRIQNRRPTASIVMSGYSTPELIARARDAGVGAYLRKPLDTGDLERAIILALARHQDLEALMEEIQQRRDAERRLAERENIYRSLVESFEGIAFRLDPAGTPDIIHGRVIERLTGYGAEELKAGAVSWRDLTHPDDRRIVEKSATSALTSPERRATVEYRMAHRDGSTRWVRASLHGCRRGSGCDQVVEGVLFDITESRQRVDRVRQALAVAERAQLEISVLYSASKEVLGTQDLQQSLHSLLEACRDVVGAAGASVEVYDPENRETRVVAQVDFPGLSSLAADPPQALAGLFEDDFSLPHTRFFHELAGPAEDPPMAAGRSLDNLLATPLHFGESASGVLTLSSLATPPSHHDERFLEAVAELTSIALHAQHMSEQLAASQARANALYLHCADAVISVDADSGLIVDVNSEAEELIGRSSDELVGAHFTTLHPHEDRELNRQLFFSHQNESLSPRQLRIERHDGTVVPVDVAASMRVPVGNQHLIFGSFRDVSERCALEDRLRRAERMDAIGQLAAGVAHDFNNQLQNILGFADLLEACLEDEQLHEYAEAIAAAAERAGELTQQLLTFSQQGVSQPAEVDLHEVIHEVVALLERSVGKELTLRCDLEAADPVVYGDRGSLQTALLNLCLNAHEATTTSSSEILITSADCSFEHAPASVTPQLAPGEYLTISVRDNGAGMSAKVRSRIFEPFFSTKQTGKAAGMGLAMVFGTTKAHGGGIRVDSSEGQGTTLTLFLPRSPHVVRTDAVSPREAEAQQSSTVMVVDDEPGIRDVLCAMLGKMGHETVAFGDGESALEHFAEHGSGIDLVVLDMVMPGMSGTEVFQRLREMAPDCRILVASGHNVAAHDMVFPDAAGVISKPFRSQALRDMVGSILNSKARED